MKSIYLDVCCLNRPFDDQSTDRVRLEAEAVVMVLWHVQSGEWRLVGSEALDVEIEENPDVGRRRRVQLLADAACMKVPLSDWVIGRAVELESIGLQAFDALHVACAEDGAADILLTTDDRFIRIARQNRSRIRVRVENPVSWLREVGRT